MAESVQIIYQKWYTFIVEIYFSQVVNLVTLALFPNHSNFETNPCIVQEMQTDENKKCQHIEN